MFSFVCGSKAATVNYSGAPTDALVPNEDDFVIAGTFTPGFDVQTSTGLTFGDPVGNWESTHYDEATSSGTFRPSGSSSARLPMCRGRSAEPARPTGIDNLTDLGSSCS